MVGILCSLQVNSLFANNIQTILDNKGGYFKLFVLIF